MKSMVLHLSTVVILSLVTAICSFIAAVYWFRSAGVNLGEWTVNNAPIENSEAIHILFTQVDILNLRVAMSNSARLNKTAAIWSGIAAGFAAITAVFAAVSWRG